MREQDMSESIEIQWRELIRDINEALNQIEGRHRQILSGSNAWLESLKNSPTFSRLPADKLAAVILKLEEILVKTGDVVIRQRDPGDYFYIVKSGSFTVSRRKGPGEVEILAQLHEGDAFGEAALLSGEARNASIVADKDGMLLRLSRNDFDTLVRTDLVRHVSMAEAERLVKDGARFLDVRRDTIGKQDIRKGALVIPIDQLRARLPEIDPHSAYVIYCLNGNLSETAAFILGQRGYNVYVLKGGQPV
jgi:rhodanese-related sulfurtransferase